MFRTTTTCLASPCQGRRKTSSIARHPETNGQTDFTGTQQHSEATTEKGPHHGRHLNLDDGKVKHQIHFTVGHSEGGTTEQDRLRVSSSVGLEHVEEPVEERHNSRNHDWHGQPRCVRRLDNNILEQ